MTEHEFLQTASLDALLAAFANAKPFKNGVVIESSYSSSIHAPYELTESIYQRENDKLIRYFGLPFTLVCSRKQCKHHFIISISESLDSFFQQVYRRIQQKRFEENITNDEFERKILLAFWGMRGSIDLKGNFYTLDLLSSVVSVEYLNMLFNLVTNLSDMRQLNFNFRELQEEYVTGKKLRNTQFRINLRYFYNKVGGYLEDVNSYKSDTLKNNKPLILTKKVAQKDKAFVYRIMFYQEKVLGKFKTENEIEQLRKELGFIYNTQIDEKTQRDQSIVQYVRAYFDDECAACKQIYPISDRTFKYRNSERYYLEVHHCISFSADRNCDQIDNLVKLCPACHRALTKGRADEEYQKLLISNIFKNAPKAKEFCLNFVSEEDCINFVYDRLR
ncbi:HNH endonuclease signature motif containing protein [Actinobacillus porcinus]|uniref:HNH endonuclease n=1 Tax=Actinobacillus porcinus TaxID=51048 RepID=A0ABY6TLI5_9PAST|nr:HNH endonuclease signature motif containing protein [Actinobacillus porcinus]MCI5764718.1 HNH endonuclease [Actinobacillus porcinus]MDY5421351.1 HNH endonuclease signature motif containing protein [Actinobacillus porcinus]VFY93797.1 HNH endonuclease [Actinobacillus porcinus]VTU09169.1 HNH endonuclease [Actinobacillus porcinus]